MHLCDVSQDKQIYFIAHAFLITSTAILLK